MIITLEIKNKIGFVDGPVSKILFDSSLHALWDRCNVVIFGWILKSFSEDLSSSIMYFTNSYVA